jgi:hypothetical protein
MITHFSEPSEVHNTIEVTLRIWVGIKNLVNSVRLVKAGYFLLQVHLHNAPV